MRLLSITTYLFRLITIHSWVILWQRLIIFSCYFRLYGSANVIFWSLFGEIDFEDFRIEESGYGAIWRTGMTLFALFNIVAVLVALNMLIAILNESYTRISVSKD